MARTMWMPALALGAVLATGGLAQASDPAQSGIGGGVITLGGVGTVADAAAAGDVELTRFHHHHYHGGYGYGYGYYGGYQPYYGGYYSSGYGFGGYSYGGYQPYYGGYCGGYYGGYRPYYSGGFGYGGYSYGGYQPYYGGFYGGYYRFSGDKADAQAPVVNLGTAPRNQTQPTADVIPIGLSGQPKANPETKPYTFKAYGQK